jgi:hypothetical protein
MATAEPRPHTVVYNSTAPNVAQEGFYIRLTGRDTEAFDTFAPVTIGYYFDSFIDPSSLVQSLAVILDRLPGYSGRIVTLDDSKSYHIKPRVHPPSITTAEVTRAVLLDHRQWVVFTDWFPLRINSIAGNKLLQVILAHTANKADGCMLMVSIDHVLADATTCSFFMADWSQQHKAMFGAGRRPLDMALPPDYTTVDGDVTIKRFYFSTHSFASLKAAINKHGPPDCQVTVNDILLAMCAVAVAYKAQRTGTHARVAVMVDPRGRGVDPNFMGNAAMPMNVFVPWAVLTAHDLPTVVRAVRRSVVEGLAHVQATATLDPSNYQTEEALLQWNSWARCRGLVDANFGEPLRKFEWVNLQNLKELKVFIVVPVTANGGLALQVALPHDLMAYLSDIWRTFTSLQAAA